MPGPSFAGMDESDMEKYLVRNVDIGASGADVKVTATCSRTLLQVKVVQNCIAFFCLQGKLWVPDKKEGYVMADIVKQDDANVTVTLPNMQEATFKKDDTGAVNPAKFEKWEDMSSLTYLNEASILHNLRTRYVEFLIYVRVYHILKKQFCEICNDFTRLFRPTRVCSAWRSTPTSGCPSTDPAA